MLRKLAIASISVSLLGGLAGCAVGDKEGVASNLRSQWTTVNTGTEVVADAAKAVFEAEGLMEVTRVATRVDGKVTGKKSDGTVITADIKRESDTTSSVSLTVGMMGDAKLGADLANKIRQKAQGR